ncbi:MAG: hypothetical protein ACRCT7_12005 [Shewanella sp.]
MKLNLVVYEGARYQGYSEDELRAFGIPDEIIEKEKAIQILSSIKDDRKTAYQNESDPLFIEWQFDQTPESEVKWRDKVAEIKQRFPLPEDI